jgi:hypothetical protein
MPTRRKKSGRRKHTPIQQQKISAKWTAQTRLKMLAYLLATLPVGPHALDLLYGYVGVFFLS